MFQWMRRQPDRRNCCTTFARWLPRRAPSSHWGKDASAERMSPIREASSPPRRLVPVCLCQRPTGRGFAICGCWLRVLLGISRSTNPSVQDRGPRKEKDKKKLPGGVRRALPTLVPYLPSLGSASARPLNILACAFSPLGPIQQSLGLSDRLYSHEDDGLLDGSHSPRENQDMRSHEEGERTALLLLLVCSCRSRPLVSTAETGRLMRMPACAWDACYNGSDGRGCSR